MSANAATPFPWDDVLAAAFGLLRWPPETVWRATPRELALALGRRAAPAAPARADLEAMMRAFPDAKA